MLDVSANIWTSTNDYECNIAIENLCGLLLCAGTLLGSMSIVSTLFSFILSWFYS